MRCGSGKMGRLSQEDTPRLERKRAGHQDCKDSAQGDNGGIDNCAGSGRKGAIAGDLTGTGSVDWALTLRARRDALMGECLSA